MWWLLLTTVLAMSSVQGYDLIRDYSGISFFDRFDFYGHWDNLTLGDVWWLNRDDAYSQHLAYINDAGNAVIKVDNRSFVPDNYKRNSVRITTQDTYSVGSLWIIDVKHIPYGCSVWGAWWSKGEVWPDNGEIDIIEGINKMPMNQYALHTTPGCNHDTAAYANWQKGTSAQSDCAHPSGCMVTENQPNSFGPQFNGAGGGVYATQFDVEGIFIWFWSRENIPLSITQSTSSSSITDFSQWGPPSASYPAATCDTTKYFGPQRLILDVTLCGAWAGIPSVYNASCGDQGGATGLCYPDNVVGPGSPKYDTAYFEIPYIRTYTTGGLSPTPASVGAAHAGVKATSLPSSATRMAEPSRLFALFWLVIWVVWA